MRFNDLIDNLMEATMSATTTPRYDFAPTAAFATTRAGAERRARETAAAATTDNGRQLPARHALRRLAALLTGSTS